MAEKTEKMIKSILAAVLTTVIITSASTQIYLMNRMSVLETKVQTNSQSVTQINSKMDTLIDSMNKLTQETIKLQEQFKYLEKGNK